MFSWNFAKSAEAVFSRLAIKKICKFLLKKKLGQFILGDIDLNQLDVQLSNGTIQLSDLALNVDFINQKFGEAAILVVKEGSIGSLTVKLPWKGRNCEVEVEELEIVLAPGGKRSSQVGNEASTSGQDGNSYIGHDLLTPEREMLDSTMITASVDIHEGVKTIAKMVKWLLTSFHVKIKKLIVALDPSSEESEEKGHGRTLVLRFGEVECGTGLSEDVNLDSQGTVDGFLGLSRLTNFVKFDGAVLEFLRLDGDGSESAFPCIPGETLGERFPGCCSLNATTPVITGEKGGFSGTIKLSIPWKNGSLDIRKLDADVYVDPLELRLQPSSLKSFMYFVHVFEKLEKDHKSFMHNKAVESVYYSASSHGYASTSGSFEFSSDKISQKPETFAESYPSTGKDTALDALLRGSHLISDWMTSPVSSNQDQKIEESDFGASVDQFFECFDELRTSQSALGNSGMWNWTCSVFSAITAASNLASGSLHIPSEQKHVETSLKARITQIVILFSFVDEDPKPSCGTKDCKRDKASYVHYINADFHDMQLVLQVCPRDLNFEATVKHIEVADHFSNASDDTALHRQKDNVNAEALLIRNKQAAVEGTCPPSGFLGQGAISNNPMEHAAANVSSNMLPSTRSRYHRGIYRDDVVKVMLLKTSAITRCQYIVPSVSPDIKSGLKSFSLKLPPLVFWVNFNLITTVLDLIKEIEDSLHICRRSDLSASVDGNSRSLSQGDITKGSSAQFMTSPKETIRGNISLLDARMILCFPCQKSEDSKSYLSWNQFIVVDLSSPLALREGMVQTSNHPSVPIPKERFRVTASHSLHLSVGNIAVYFVASASKDGTVNCRMQKFKFCAKRVLSVSDTAGHPSFFSMIWQDSAVTGPWITKRAKVLATSDGTTSRNKSTGKGHGLAFVTTTKDMEDFNSQTREEIVLSSSFFLHAHLSPVTINLDNSLYQNLQDLLHQVTEWLSCISFDTVAATEKDHPCQLSILVECDLVEISVSVAAVEGIKGSIQNELPGSWCKLKLKVGKFELLTVSNTGGVCGANFLWVAHGEGDLWGSTSEVPEREFILISCDNSTRGRGNGEGSNILSSRFPGSDIIHMWDLDNFVSQVSINIRCATIVAVGGRLDWFDTITSFFSTASTGSDQVDDGILENEDFRKDTSRGSCFVLNLIDFGISYEPYSCNMVAPEDSCPESSSAYVNGKMSEQFVAGLLAASNLKLSNVSAANSVEVDYEIKAHDVGLLLCEVSGLKNLGRSYGEQNLQKSGYVKVAEETHVEVALRTNCKNGLAWEVECSESHIVLDTCQDSASKLVRLAAQIQQIFAPDVEESFVHLQTRWDNIQLAQESYKSRSSSNHSTSSSSQVHDSSSDTKGETYTANLMDEISEGAFNLDGSSGSRLEAHALSTDDHECVPHKLKVPVPVFGVEDNETWSSHASFPEFIEGYFLSDLHRLSEPSLNNQLQKESLSRNPTTPKEADAQVGSGWYGDSLLRIVEDHVLGIGEKTNSKQLFESETSIIQTGNVGCRKVKGRVLLKNIDVRWKLYAGSNWQYTKANFQHAGTCTSDKAVCLEFALSRMGFQCDIFPDGDICVSKLSLSVEDFSLNDVSKGAPWRQVLGCYQSKECPRESRSRAFKLELESVRPHPSIPLEEYRLQIALLPMRLHLHQSQLEFLINFFGGKSSSSDQDMGELDMPQKNAINLGSRSITEEALLPYFQKFSISPVVVRVDYIPSRVDLAAVGHGKYVELVNLFQWKGVELQLKHVQAVGVYGWASVCETIIGEWLEDISQNQIHKLLKGLPPIRSLVAVGSSAAKLVSLPVKNYRKDRRIVKGMQRGTIAFLRSVSLEAIGLGAHLAAGAHAILLQAEDIISTSPPTSIPRPIQSNRVNPNVRSGQPKDARQGIQQALETITDGIGRSASALVQTPLKRYQRGAGVGSALSTAVQAVPGAAIAPASATARAVHSALLGVRNSLDPEHKKDSMDKYLGTTQSRPL